MAEIMRSFTSRPGYHANSYDAASHGWVVKLHFQFMKRQLYSSGRVASVSRLKRAHAFSLSLSLSLTNIHTRTYTHAHIHSLFFSLSLYLSISLLPLPHMPAHSHVFRETRRNLIERLNQNCARLTRP